MEKIIKRHKNLWSSRKFILATTTALIFFAIGLATTYYGNYYASLTAGGPVSDLILDNIPAINMDFLFTYGALIFSLAVLVILIFYKPEGIPFVIKSAALFIIIRSGFIILTHFGPPNNMSYIDPNSILYKFSSGDDLFFSGHTGFPFLMAFIFWDNKYLRYLFLAATAIAGVGVLLGHLHYSIDVFSALFIAYGIFQIAKKIFPKDYALMKNI